MITVLVLTLLPLLTGVFLILSSARVLPHPLNVSSSWGPWGFVAGGGSIAFALLALYFSMRKKEGTQSSEKSNPNSIVDLETLKKVKGMETRKQISSTLLRVLKDNEFVVLKEELKGKNYSAPTHDLFSHKKGVLRLPNSMYKEESKEFWVLDEEKLAELLESDYKNYKRVGFDELLQRIQSAEKH